MKKNPLVLITQEKNLFFPEKCENCSLYSLYKTNRLWHRVLRKLLLKAQSPTINLLFSHWEQDACLADTIIIFDTGNVVEIVKWLRRKFPNKRIIVWYWNSVSVTVKPTEFKVDKIEFWSFDVKDCEQYGFKYNTQFFIEDNMKRVATNSKFETDVFYIGADKNRAIRLKDLREVFQKNDILYEFHLVKYKDSKNNYGFEYKEPLVYSDILGKIKQSRVIIDLVADWQSGLTLRPLEALFYKKKLITNMKSIINYDIYNPHNIFILDVDSIENLKDFIETPYDDSRNSMLEAKYSFAGWLNRFYDGSEEFD